jgi:hypothetical protein
MGVLATVGGPARRDSALHLLAEPLEMSGYGRYLMQILTEENPWR